MQICAAVEGDAPALARLHVAAWRAAYRGLMPDRVVDGLSVESRERAWSTRLGAALDPEARTWLAVEGDALLGFAASGRTRDDDVDAGRTAELYALYLDPARVGQGLGRALFDHTKADLRARGWREVSAWVLAGNARAERFYAAAGLVREKEAVHVVDGAPLPHARWVGAL